MYTFNSCIGCALLQVGWAICLSTGLYIFEMLVSLFKFDTGTPPPIPVNPNLECGPETAGNKTCPLNACCSAFGYCGLTSDFCVGTVSHPFRILLTCINLEYDRRRIPGKQYSCIGINISSVLSASQTVVQQRYHLAQTQQPDVSVITKAGQVNGHAPQSRQHSWT